MRILVVVAVLNDSVVTSSEEEAAKTVREVEGKPDPAETRVGKQKHHLPLNPDSSVSEIFSTPQSQNLSSSSEQSENNSENFVTPQGQSSHQTPAESSGHRGE